MSNKYAGGIKAGSTSVTCAVLLRLAADGTEMTGVASGSVTASYQRQGAAVTTFAASALASATAAWSAGGWFELSSANQPGQYRLDVPDAAFASGVDFVVVAVKVATAYTFYERFALETQGASELNTLIGAAGAGLTSVRLAAAGLDSITVESGVNARQALSPILSASAGVLTGVGSGTIVVRAGNNAGTTRITTTVDASKNRTGVVLNLPT